eukprot:Tamp_04725.p1 GENE.Tamp_04725~~Tamp_04725.p1  ORF type:complete len:860 (-),score=122.47 Tamp_04725:284-2863(-)
MVEDIDNASGSGRRRIIFLTNAQAELIATQPDAIGIKRLIQALEIPKPKLVISIISSWGFAEFTACQGTPDGNRWEGASADAWKRGMVQGRSPFVSEADERRAREGINNFMRSVIIPLAAKTNAIILCEAVEQVCILSAALREMVAVMRSTWPGELPFTILSVTSETACLYKNEKLDAEWRRVRRACRGWRERDKLLTDLVATTRPPSFGGSQDLDSNAELLMVVDAINEKKRICHQRGTQAQLTNEIVRYFASSIPSLVLQTGSSMKCSMRMASIASSSLRTTLNAALAGSPVLFLDVRQRGKHEGGGVRSALIETAKREVVALGDELREKGLADTFDVCALAFFRDILLGDGDPYSTDLPNKTSEKPMPLHLAIQMEENGDDIAHDGMGPATSEQILECANWIADQMAWDAWRMLPDVAERESRGETHETSFGSETRALAAHLNLLFTSPNVHHLNLNDVQGCARLVRQLVQLDRVPAKNPIAGLLLLRQAWNEFDVVVHLSASYKFWSKVLYIVQLAFAWLLVVATTARNSICSDENNAASEDECLDTFETGIFFAAALASFILFLDNMIFSTKRWRQLRSGAGSLESIIWMYRGRCGPFARESHGAHSSAEEVLQKMVSGWMDDLVAGADLSRTSISRKYRDDVYKHGQYFGDLVTLSAVAATKESPADASASARAVDDFHSPVQPERYINLRLRPMMAFYQSRIPGYTRSAFFMQLCLGVFSLAASALAYLKLADFVVVVSAGGAAVTSYLEFADTQRKIERYTRAVRSLQKTLNWWTTLDSVERAGAAATTTLLTTGETIISEERLAWQPLNIGPGVFQNGSQDQDQEKSAEQPGAGPGSTSGTSKVHPERGL